MRIPANRRPFHIWPAFLALTLLVLWSGSDARPAVAGGPTWLVNTNVDAADAAPGAPCDYDLGTAGDQCTLRAALALANSSPGSFVTFALPDCPAVPSTCVITPNSDLPTITATATNINATTQPGYTGTPLVTIDGTGSPATNGLVGGADSFAVQGMVIRDFSGAGIGFVLDFWDLWLIGGNLITGNGGPGLGLPPGQEGVNAGHVVSNNVIANNGGDGIAADSCPQSTDITSNTITGQAGAGIRICGAGNAISFNRIVGNAIGVKDLGFTNASDAENNWWGCNDGPGMPGCDTTDQTDGLVDSDPWLVMGFSASPDPIVEGQTSTLTADFTRNSDAADTSGLGHLPDGTMVTFHTDLGSVGSQTVDKPTVGGVATATLTADGGPGIAHVDAVLDNETQLDQVTITAATPTPTLSPSPTSSPTDSPTPSPTATAPPTASPTPPPTPTATPPGTGRVWGDSDCDGEVTSRDSQAVLRDVLDQPALSQEEPCPDLGDAVTANGDPDLWGDWDCDGEISSRDSQALLRNVLSQPALSQTEPCPDVGADVSVVS